MQTEPLKMTTPVRDTQTNSKRIVVDWPAATTSTNGGASITSYNLMWDAGTSGVSWFSLIGGDTQGPYTLTTFTVTSGVSMG